MSDPYDWQGPDCAPEDMSDADWLRSEARANFITEDIERADRIAARVETAQAELVRQDDELVAWQEASGLTAGGDPGGVTPRDLAAFIRKASDVERAVRSLRDVLRVAEVAPGERRVWIAAGDKLDRAYLVDALDAALAAMPKAD